MARKKTTVPETNLSDAQLEKHLEEYSLAESRLEGQQAKLNEQLTKVREKFAPKIDEEKRIMNEHFDALHAHALTQKAQFEKKRSKDMTHGIFGFRYGNMALKSQKGFTWGAVLQLIEDNKLTDFIKIKKDVAKDKIIANREQLIKDGTMDKIKCYVDQKETFFVESKAEKQAA